MLQEKNLCSLGKGKDFFGRTLKVQTTSIEENIGKLFKIFFYSKPLKKIKTQATELKENIDYIPLTNSCHTSCFL